MGNTFEWKPSEVRRRHRHEYIQQVAFDCFTGRLALTVGGGKGEGAWCRSDVLWRRRVGGGGAQREYDGECFSLGVTGRGIKLHNVAQTFARRMCARQL